MKYLIFAFLTLLYSCSPICYNEQTIILFNKFYGCYECKNGELEGVVKLGKNNNCIYEILNETLLNGSTKAVSKSYELSIRSSYKLLKTNSDSLLKKHNFKATEDEIVNLYLSDQKASYQIRSIEPMFRIDKEKTKKIVNDFIKKAEIDSTIARKDVVIYAKKKLTFYSK